MKPTLFLLFLFSISSLAFAFNVSNQIPLPATWIAGDTMHTQVVIDSLGPFNISLTPSINGTANPNEFILNSSQLSCNATGTIWDCGTYAQGSAGHYIIDFYLTPSFYVLPDNYNLDFTYSAYADEPSNNPPGPVYYSGGSTGNSFYGSSWPSHTPQPPKQNTTNESAPLNVSNSSNSNASNSSIPTYNNSQVKWSNSTGNTKDNSTPVWTPPKPEPTITPDLSQPSTTEPPAMDWTWLGIGAVCLIVLGGGIILWVHFFKVKT